MEERGLQHILLAEDDDDDTLLFREVLGEIPVKTEFSRVRDGEELMMLLNNEKTTRLPDVIFLDINMPRKNGFECLVEIKNSERLKEVPVVVLSTSSGKELVSKMYDAGASLYICKPNQFSHLKKIIQLVIASSGLRFFPQPPFEDLCSIFDRRIIK